MTIPASTQILRDGETTRYLGAEMGNKMNNDAPWPQIIEKIEKSLKIWEKAYPGMEGSKHIIQMIIGGKTQYITTAQGMPDHHVNYLTKRIRTFLWNTEAAPPVAMDFLTEPPSQGG